MAIFIAIIYFIVNIVIIVKNTKKYDGSLRAPNIVCLISIFSLGPLMIQNLVMPIFDKDILPVFYLSIIACIIAFNIGFGKGCQARFVQTKGDISINVEKLKFTTIIFTTLGYIGLLAYRGLIHAFDWVVAGYLQSFGVIAVCISLTAVKEKGIKKCNFVYLLSLLISTWCLIDFALNIKGSRTRLFTLVVLYAIYLTRIYPKYSKLICRIFIYLFIVGSVFSFSITTYRSSLDKSLIERLNINEIIHNFESNIYGDVKISINGQDLYNGAKYSDYCWRNLDYNFGTSIWNGLVFNFVPSRFVGEDNKNSMMIPLENRKLVSQITHGVTTVTGFGEAFAAFSIFGFLLFWVISYFMGKWWIKSFKSDFHILLYCYSIMYVSPLITHGITYFVSQMVLFSILFLPIFKLTSHKKCQQKKIAIG